LVARVSDRFARLISQFAFATGQYDEACEVSTGEYPPDNINVVVENPSGRSVKLGIFSLRFAERRPRSSPPSLAYTDFPISV
jgi:hypothetical protein